MTAVAPDDTTASTVEAPPQLSAPDEAKDTGTSETAPAPAPTSIVATSSSSTPTTTTTSTSPQRKGSRRRATDQQGGMTRAFTSANVSLSKGSQLMRQNTMAPKRTASLASSGGTKKQRRYSRRMSLSMRGVGKTPLQLLRTVDMFKSFEQVSLEKIVESLESVTWKNGAALMCQGDTCTDGYLITAGVVVVEHDAKPVARLYSGRFVGEAGLLGEEITRSASVFALGKVETLRLDASVFKAVVAELKEEPLRRAVYRDIEENYFATIRENKDRADLQRLFDRTGKIKGETFADRKLRFARKCCREGKPQRDVEQTGEQLMSAERYEKVVEAVVFSMRYANFKALGFTFAAMLLSFAAVVAVHGGAACEGATAASVTLLAGLDNGTFGGEGVAAMMACAYDGSVTSNNGGDISWTLGPGVSFSPACTEAACAAACSAPGAAAGCRYRAAGARTVPLALLAGYAGLIGFCTLLAVRSVSSWRGFQRLWRFFSFFFLVGSTIAIVYAVDVTFVFAFLSFDLLLALFLFNFAYNMFKISFPTSVVLVPMLMASAVVTAVVTTRGGVTGLVVDDAVAVFRVLVVGFAGWVFLRHAHNHQLMFRAQLVEVDWLMHEEERLKQIINRMIPPTILDMVHASSTGSVLLPFKQITILFWSMSNFKDLIDAFEGKDALSLFAVLDDLYQTTDRVVVKYGLYTVEHINADYVVTSSAVILTEEERMRVGCDTRNFRMDEAVACVELACTILNKHTVYKTPSGDEIELQFKFGINSGQAVCGIIGTSCKFYRVFGDVINTAARMYAYGKVGKVHVSDATAKLLKKTEVELISRGTINVKGKGEMESYFVADAYIQQFLKGLARVATTSAERMERGGWLGAGVDITHNGTTSRRRLTKSLRGAARSAPESVARRQSQKRHVSRQEVTDLEDYDRIKHLLDERECEDIYSRVMASRRHVGPPINPCTAMFGTLRGRAVSAEEEQRRSMVSLSNRRDDWWSSGMTIDEVEQDFRAKAATISHFSKHRLRWKMSNLIFVLLANLAAVAVLDTSKVGGGVVLYSTIGGLVLVLGAIARASCVKRDFGNAEQHRGHKGGGAAPSPASAAHMSKAAARLGMTAADQAALQVQRRRTLCEPLGVCALVAFVGAFIQLFGLALGGHEIHALLACGATITFLLLDLVSLQQWILAVPVALMTAGVAAAAVAAGAGRSTGPAQALLCSIPLLMHLGVIMRNEFQRAHRSREGWWHAKRLKMRTSKQEAVLHSILPRHTVLLLRKNMSTKQRNRGRDCCVLCTDLKGFTDLSANNTQLKVVTILDSIFTRFDAATEKCRGNIFKMDTIGDAYIVIGGMSDQSDVEPTFAGWEARDEREIGQTCINMCRLGLTLQLELDKFRRENDIDVRMRVGINKGPIVAGIVGFMQPRFHVYGRTLLDAELLEQTCPVGKVHISFGLQEKVRKHDRFGDFHLHSLEDSIFQEKKMKKTVGVQDRVGPSTFTVHHNTHWAGNREELAAKRTSATSPTSKNRGKRKNWFYKSKVPGSPTASVAPETTVVQDFDAAEFEQAPKQEEEEAVLSYWSV